MSFFSSKRSSTQESSSSTSSLPLNDTYCSETKAKSVRRSRSFLGKLRTPGHRNKRRSRSPIPQQLPRSYSPTPTPQPQPHPTSLEEEMKSPPLRKGMNFCGFCDMRIATVLLNILHMAVAVATELIDAQKYMNRNYFQEPPILLLIVIGISGLGLFGALHFLKCYLVLSSTFLTIIFYLYAIELRLLGLIVAAMVFYVQIVLANEISCGIMSEETYEMEEYIDDKSRKVFETVHSLSVDIGETASEFVEEVALEVKGKSSEAKTPKKVENC